MNNTYIYLGLGVSALITWLIRTAPFLIFKDGDIPEIVRYLGYALPPAIMIILVIYCLRDVSFTTSPYGIPEAISIILILIVHLKKRSMLVSMLVGTLSYMALLRIF